jgi:hypothetical protein
MAEDGGIRMEQHDGELTCGPSHPRASQRDTVRRDCGHPGSPHAHGTRAAYVSDRCGCTRCRAANRAADEHRTAAIAVGRWDPYAAAQPVREHLEHLRQQGLGIERIAQLSNVSKGTVRRLLSYPLDPEAPPHRTRAVTARRLLALTLATANGSPRRLVAADATRERIDALTAAGHSLTELARRIGKTPESLRRSLSRRSVTVQTAMSVEALYESLGQPCPRRRPPPDFPAQSSTFSNSRSSRGGSDFAWGGTPRSGFTRKRHPFNPDCTGTSRKSRRVAANVGRFQQARRLDYIHGTHRSTKQRGSRCPLHQGSPTCRRRHPRTIRPNRHGNQRCHRRAGREGPRDA